LGSGGVVSLVLVIIADRIGVKAGHGITSTRKKSSWSFAFAKGSGIMDVL
jgi:hypothetical protein